jgi:hypothetical protein
MPQVARFVDAPNPEVAGSNPSRATKQDPLGSEVVGPLDPFIPATREMHRSTVDPGSRALR